MIVYEGILLSPADQGDSWCQDIDLTDFVRVTTGPNSIVLLIKSVMKELKGYIDEFSFFSNFA